MTANRAFQEASPSLFGFVPAEDDCTPVPPQAAPPGKTARLPAPAIPGATLRPRGRLGRG